MTKRGTVKRKGAARQPAPAHATWQQPNPVDYAEALLEFGMIRANLETLAADCRRRAADGDDVTLWTAELARGIRMELSHDWAAGYAAVAVAMLAELGAGDRS